MNIEIKEYSNNQGFSVDISITGEVLTPCPFCGSSDISILHTWTHNYWAECNDCGCCKGTDSHVELENENDLDKLKDAHIEGFQGAVNAWNTRATQAED